MNTLIYVGLTVEVIINKGTGKQTQSQSLRDWFEVGLGGEAPISSNKSSHTTSLDIPAGYQVTWTMALTQGAVPVSL